MNLHRSKPRITAVLCGLLLLIASAMICNAQTARSRQRQKNQIIKKMNAKIEQLEKQVADLQKQLGQLKQPRQDIFGASVLTCPCLCYPDFLNKSEPHIVPVGNISSSGGGIIWK